MIPPPVIVSARIVEYATIDDSVRLTGRTVRFLGGRPPGTAPRLAIGVGLADGQVRLMHCDTDWNLLAASDHESVELARRAAEEIYSGVGARWLAAAYSDSEVGAFLDDEDEGLICSFCGRHPHEYDKLVTGQDGAAICDRCIRELRRGIAPGPH